jgi:hypothetical protein
LATVFAVVLALQKALEDAKRARHPEAHPPIDAVTVPKLIEVGGLVELNADLLVAGGELADMCERAPILDDPGRIRRRSAKTAPAEDVSEILNRSGLTEYRLAKHFHVDRDRLAAVSFRLWRSTFSAERDRRAGPAANQQKKGRITREMRAEVKKALADGND